MKIERIKITPAVAKEWLEHLPEYQRHVDLGQVEKIAMAIKAGQWRENGATFVFNSKGEFVNGQHRAHAIIQADRSVWGLVVKNVDSSPETFETIDDSKARMLRDFLHVPSANTVAAVAKIYWLVVKGHWPQEPKLPIADCLKLAKPKLEEIGDSVRQTHAATNVVGEGSFLSFCYFYYTYVLHLNQPKITNFFARLADGVNLSATSPITLLRNRLLGVSKMGTNFNLSRVARRALIIKSLNAELRGQSLSKLSWDPNREEFPGFFGSDNHRNREAGKTQTGTAQPFKNPLA